METDFLRDRFKVAAAMAAGAGIGNLPESQFILDIDLDYFGTAQAVHPDDASFFDMLARNARFITVALEPEFVRRRRLEPELEAEWLLGELLRRLELAMS